MADPAFIDIPAGAWTLVAQNVVTGLIWKRTNRNTKILQTYRDTGGEAPTLRTEGVECFFEGYDKPEVISASVPIDVYLYSIDDASRVRVDL